MMLAAMQGSNPQVDSNSLPDTDGTFQMSVQDPAQSATEAGVDVLTRITLLNVGPGASDLTLTYPDADEVTDSIADTYSFAEPFYASRA